MFYFFYNTGCIKKLNKFEIALNVVKRLKSTKFLGNIDCLGTYDVELKNS